MQTEIKKKPLPTMDIAESLEKRIKKQEDEDLKRYREKKSGMNQSLMRKDNIGLEGRPTGRQD